MLKLFPLVDERPTCQTVGDFLRTTNLLVDREEDADVFLVAGGDGWMLDMMRRYHDHGKPFLGINCGTLGFLLNTLDEQEFVDLSWEQLDRISAPLVGVDIEHVGGLKEAGFFINDLTIGASVLDYFTFMLQGKEVNIEAMGTGLVVCTTLGSTAYAANLGQPILPLESNLRGVSGIATAPFRYDFLQPQRLQLTAKGRNPLLIGLDGYNEKHENIKTIEIYPLEKEVELCFFKTQKFQDKRLFLAHEKLG